MLTIEEHLLAVPPMQASDGTFIVHKGSRVAKTVSFITLACCLLAGRTSARAVPKSQCACLSLSCVCGTL